jgi:hypothetical protein
MERTSTHKALKEKNTTRWRDRARGSELLVHVFIRCSPYWTMCAALCNFVSYLCHRAVTNALIIAYWHYFIVLSSIINADWAQIFLHILWGNKINSLVTPSTSSFIYGPSPPSIIYEIINSICMFSNVRNSVNFSYDLWHSSRFPIV